MGSHRSTEPWRQRARFVHRSGIASDEWLRRAHCRLEARGQRPHLEKGWQEMSRGYSHLRHPHPVSTRMVVMRNKNVSFEGQRERKRRKWDLVFVPDYQMDSACVTCEQISQDKIRLIQLFNESPALLLALSWPALSNDSFYRIHFPAFHFPPTHRGPLRCRCYSVGGKSSSVGGRFKQSKKERFPSRVKGQAALNALENKTCRAEDELSTATFC